MQSVNESKPYFLYVEDDLEDLELLKHALAETQFDFDIIHVNDGDEACTYLESCKDFKRLPELIFLDVKMSRLDGKETFLCLKADRELARIPIVVLSTSNSEGIIKFFGQYHIPYIVKPGDMPLFRENLLEVLKGLLAFEYNFKSAGKKNDAA
ncbi:MAG: response regulator [Chitinophagaceae bacterium]|jgi:two-component system response regulator|nr:response regulator [Chitinophagaceae bacterium]